MKAFFPGSFNPFTTGHLDILARTLKMCGDAVVAVGCNEHKPDATDAARRCAEELRSLLDGIPGVSVMLYSGLTVEAARMCGADIIVRGFRNAIDAEYERQLADTNRLISRIGDDPRSGIDTWLIPARPELACISSSMVRELSHNGFPVDSYLPSHEECVLACSHAN